MSEDFKEETNRFIDSIITSKKKIKIVSTVNKKENPFYRIWKNRKVKSAEEFVKEYDQKHGTSWSDSSDEIAKVMEEYAELKVNEALNKKDI